MLSLGKGKKMIRIISAVDPSTFQRYNDQKPSMKYYNNQVQKQTVKNDFQLHLDSEIKKLKIDIFL